MWTRRPPVKSPFELTAEMQEAIDRGEEYSALIACRGWERLKKECLDLIPNEYLELIRKNESSSPELAMALQLRFKTAIEVVAMIHTHIDEWIFKREAILAEMKESEETSEHEYR